MRLGLLLKSYYIRLNFKPLFVDPLCLVLPKNFFRKRLVAPVNSICKFSFHEGFVVHLDS
jgi:hypothetical protein